MRKAEFNPVGGDMKLNHFKLILFSGLVWFGIGIYLLSLGMHFIVGTATSAVNDTSSLIALFSPIAGSREQAGLLLIVLGLMLGFLKGRFVLSKTVQRVVQRIISLPLPIKISQVYGVRYLALIGFMVLLGMSLKWFKLPLEVRGLVDVAIGSALMNGALGYFRLGFAFRKQQSNGS
ncbi:MAG: hypothetical protein KF898_06735 [Parachlamydiales bacterium]|nr:hypothetical protein [Verrucomicrobiota bacterium]MBX3719327.1 hypothetical protein [Candidatus Acheromyda pituitae]